MPIRISKIEGSKFLGKPESLVTRQKQEVQPSVPYLMGAHSGVQEWSIDTQELSSEVPPRWGVM